MIDQCLSCTEPYCDSCVTTFCDCATGLCDPCAERAAERCPECGDQTTTRREAEVLAGPWAEPFAPLLPGGTS